HINDNFAPLRRRSRLRSISGFKTNPLTDSNDSICSRTDTKAHVPRIPFGRDPVENRSHWSGQQVPTNAPMAGRPPVGHLTLGPGVEAGAAPAVAVSSDQRR